MKFVQWTTPAASASSTSSRDSAAVRASGFSVDAVVLEQLTQAPVHVAEPCFGSSIRARADDAEHVDAETPQRVDMNGRDEAGADERGG